MLSTFSIHTPELIVAGCGRMPSACIVAPISHNNIPDNCQVAHRPLLNCLDHSLAPRASKCRCIRVWGFLPISHDCGLHLAHKTVIQLDRWFQVEYVRFETQWISDQHVCFRRLLLPLIRRM